MGHGPLGAIASVGRDCRDSRDDRPPVASALAGKRKVDLE